MNSSDKRVKYKALKKDNSKLVSILYSKDNQMKILESQLRALEQEFLKYKSTCEEILQARQANPQLIDQSKSLINTIQADPNLIKIGQTLGVKKLKNCIKTNKLQEALKISLTLNQVLASTSNRPIPSKYKHETQESLTKESEFLLQSIHEQSDRISKMMKRSNDRTPKTFKKQLRFP